jgi:hypothetical protein
MSPAKPFAEATGNDNTSVPLLLPRNREFNRRMLEFPVIKTLMSPRSPAARHAFRANPAIARELNPGNFFSKTIIELLNFVWRLNASKNKRGRLKRPPD